MAKSWLDAFGPEPEAEQQGSWLDAFGPEPEPAPPAPQAGVAPLQADPWSMLAEPPEAPLPSIARTTQERFLLTVGPVVGTVFDVLQRGQYASAAAPQELLRRAPQIEQEIRQADESGAFGPVPEAGIPGLVAVARQIPAALRATIEGLRGERKVSYIDVLNEAMPDAPQWLRSSLGFLLDVGLDPTTYLSFGGGALVKVGGRTLIPGVGLLDEVAPALRRSEFGKWLTKHFSTTAGVSDEAFWRLYRLSKNQMEYMVRKAVEQNVPLERAVRDIEKHLGIPRNVIMELLERPEEVRRVSLIQERLPFTETVERPLFNREYLGRVNEIIRRTIIEPGMLPKGYKRTLGEIRTLEDVKQAEELLVDLYMDAIADRFANVPGARNDPWFQRFAVRDTRAAKVIRQKETNSPIWQELREEARRQLDEGNIIPEFPKEWADLWDYLRLLEDPEFHTKIQRRRAHAYQEALPFTETVTRPLFPEPEVLGEATERVSRLSAYPTEVQNVVEQIRTLQESRLQREIAAGINIAPFESDVLQYMPHYLTPEAKQALGRNYQSQLRRLIDATVQHPSTKQRVFLRDLSVEQINQMAREGKLRHILGDYTGPVFVEDPVLVNTIRDMMSARAIAAADFIKRVRDNPEWAQPLATAGEGFRTLTGSAAERFGPLVEGYAFRDDIADALEAYVRKAFDPEQVDLFIRMYDRWLSAWKLWTLGTSPAWMLNNLIGNLWNGVVLAGSNPVSLEDAFRVLMRGRAQQLWHQVRQGETLSAIAKRYGTTVEELASVNKIADPNKIIAGQRLLIPQGKAKIAGMTDAEVLDLAERYGVLYQGLYGAEIGETLGQQLGRESLGRRAVLALPRTTFTVNRAMENWSRLALFIDGLKRGMSPEDAAMRVKKYLFDYAELTDTEKNVMRRVVPFYSWVRKNLPLQIEALVTTPGRQAVLPKALSAYQSTLEQVEPAALQPEWMQTGLYLQTGEPQGGNVRFLSLRGLPPVDLFELLGQFAGHPTEDPLTRAILGAPRAAASLFVTTNPALNALLTALGLNAYAGREIPPTQATEIIPGVAVSSRLAEFLYSLAPPLQTISRVGAPYQTPLRQAPPLAQRVAETLVGARVYDRNIFEDLRRFVSTYNPQTGAVVADLQRQYENALASGNETLAAFYEARLYEILAHFLATIPAISETLPGPGAP